MEVTSESAPVWAALIPASFGFALAWVRPVALQPGGRALRVALVVLGLLTLAATAAALRVATGDWSLGCAPKFATTFPFPFLAWHDGCVARSIPSALMFAAIVGNVTVSVGAVIFHSEDPPPPRHLDSRAGRRLSSVLTYRRSWLRGAAITIVEYQSPPADPPKSPTGEQNANPSIQNQSVRDNRDKQKPHT